MATPRTEPERQVLALIDRGTRMRAEIQNRLDVQVKKILAELFVQEREIIENLRLAELNNRPDMPLAKGLVGWKGDTPGESRVAVELDKKHIYTADLMRERRAAAKRISALVTRAETMTANIAAAQQDALLRTAKKNPRLGAVTLPARPRKVDPEAEWMRAIYEWTEAARLGRDLDEAARLAAARAEHQIENDLALARRDSNKEHRDRNANVVTGYRRVIHPEMSESHTSCGLCVAASVRKYKREDLEPLHDHCNCDTVPILKDDPEWGAWINDRDRAALDQIYTDAKGNTAKKLGETRYRIEMHDELGPRLVAEPEARNFRAKRRRVRKHLKSDKDS